MNHSARKIEDADQDTTVKRTRLTKMVMRLFTEWELTTAEQLQLLGLKASSRKMLTLYRTEQGIIPDEQDKLTRVGLLLAIYQNLHALFPENTALQVSWVKRHNADLNAKRPIDIMLDQGLFGIAKVMRFLDAQLVN